MKNNLKTFPSDVQRQDWREALKWKEDFEAELREEIEKCKRAIHADGRLVGPGVRYRLIMEILGEN